tara:strand:- start:613 stop:801 length:189 start_codon:yes stop_codon:yes gene_type:complete
MKQGDLVVHKKYGVGVVLEVKEIYSSWGHPNVWYQVLFASDLNRSNPCWMAAQNLEVINESG